MPAVATAQAERTIAPDEIDAYVAEFEQDPHVTPVVDGVGGISDAELAEYHDLVRATQEAGNPETELVPGEMWSDTVGLPPSVDKADADAAEIAIATEQHALPSIDTLNTLDAQTMVPASAHCKTFLFSPHQVCGAILERYEALGGLLSWLMHPIEPMHLNPDGQGYRQRFQNGFIYWHPATGAHAVTVRNANVWERNGWEQGWLGYPLGGEVPVKGTTPTDGELHGWVQIFQGGRIYRTPLNQGPQVASINGLILEKWLELGGPDSDLGFPLADEAKTADGVGRFSVFQHGSIYWHPSHGAHPVFGMILDEWAASGFETGAFGYPTQDPTSTEPFKFKQHFQNGVLNGFGPPVSLLAKELAIGPAEMPEMYSTLTHLFQSNAIDIQAGFHESLSHARDSARASRDEIIRLQQEISPANRFTQGNGNYSPQSIDLGMRNDCRDAQLIAPGNGRTNPGDFFYSGATTTRLNVEVNHGHTGIFVERRGTTPDTIKTVEAVDPTRGVMLLSGDRKGVCNPRYFSVNTDNKIRLAATQFARRQVGKGYNSNFATSRSATADSPSYNCSSLVWAAFMHASGGRLDLGLNKYYSGYRAGVYPVDLANSIHTREFQ